MKIRLIILSVLVIFIATQCAPASNQASGLSNQPASSSVDVKVMVESKCSTCHTYDRVKTAKKSVDEWKTNVERMVAKGAKLSSEEQTAAIKYLSATFPK